MDAKTAKEAGVAFRIGKAFKQGTAQKKLKQPVSRQ